MGVDPEWEWEPGLVEFRGHLERRFLDALLDDHPPERVAPHDVEARLHQIVAAEGGPSLSHHLSERGTLGELRELAIHRSAYQLKEADPHTWAIPRLSGEPKAAMVEIQSDEYGCGRRERMHSELFATTMATLDLDPTYGAYLDLLPGVTLATVNLVSLFGLHRRWRGALVGHLAVFEMSSVTPMSRYATSFDRLGLSPKGREFYDVHVVADALHEKIAATRLAGAFARDEPSLAGDVIFGATALVAAEQRFTNHLLDAWSAGRPSLLAPCRAAA
ncbi:MAG TPA: iron-containing redox enzyme family protein [Acidimicrobiales bacterium]|nr:iron-containing redox enzyme family protein [Acidimicrobiales bacterium]